MKAALDRIINSVTYIGMFIVIGIAVLTGLDACGRYLFAAPVKGAYDLTQVFFSSIVAFGIAVTTAADTHIMVDVLYVKLAPLGQYIVKLFANTVGILVLAVLIWQGIISGLMSMAAHEETEVLRVPIYPFRFVLVFGFFLSLIALMFRTAYLIFSRKADVRSRSFR